MYKVKNYLAPSYVIDLFNERETVYNMRNADALVLPKFNSIKYGKRSLTFYGAKLWNNLPQSIKDSPSLFVFKKNITKWLRELDSIDNILFN